jgi:hypothetical protein
MYNLKMDNTTSSQYYEENILGVDQQLSTLGLQLLKDIATKALDLKFEAEQELEGLDAQEPLRVLAIVKKKLNDLKGYIRHVSDDGVAIRVS